MANKIYNFETPSEYSYDTNKILVSGGIVSLKEDLTNVYARYHLNETSGIIVNDSSGNGRNGTLINSPSWVAGKLNNCLSFESPRYVTFGNIASFERTQVFSIELWMSTTSGGTLISRRESSGNYRGWEIMYSGGVLYFYFANITVSKMISVSSSSYLADGLWHHIIVTYNGSSLASGVKIYIDASLKSLTIQYNTLTDTTITGNDCHLAARSGSSVFNGKIDECLIYTKELSSSEVIARYNSGIGSEYLGFAIDNPTIRPTTSWQVSGLSQWFAFAETLGGGNQGNFGYQLSNDDGITYYYWNGSAWIIATTQYNSAAVIGAHISTFPTINSKIMFKAFLISNGVQQCLLDAIEITATQGYPPNVYAGTDKNCRDHEIKKLFSDAVINDPDGSIENATAYRKIESEIWTQILKGSYGTLQDAIRNFEYTFDNLGTITCQLKIVDEQAFENTDSMIETVSKYQVTFNIKDSDGNHLANVLCNFDDGAGWLMKNSPFTYEFEHLGGGGAIIYAPSIKQDLFPKQ
jgi:hypothetical protein